MAKRGGGSSILNFIAWLTGVIVSLAVAFGMIEGILRLPPWLGGQTVAGVFIVTLAGWIVIVTTLVGAVLAILNK